MEKDAIVGQWLARLGVAQAEAAEACARLAAAATRRRYGAGEAIFQKGDAGTAVMIVASGRVAIASRSIDGRPIVLDVMGPGELFGEVAAVDGGPRTADATAIEGTDVLAIPRDAFVDFLERSAAAPLALLRLICERFRAADETIEDLHVTSARARLAKRLLGLAEHQGEPAADGRRVRLSQAMLAKMAGTTREAVNRSLGHWERQGLVRVEHGHVVVVDSAGLEAEVARLVHPPAPR